MKNLTLKQAIDDFIMTKSANWVKKTVEFYNQNLGYFVIWYTKLKAMDSNQLLLNDITNKELNEYLMYLRNKSVFEDHPIHKGKTEKLSNNTIRTYQRALRVFLNYCYSEDYLTTDLAKKFKFIRETKNIVFPLYQNEVEELDALFNAKCMQGARNLCIIHLMIDAGLRSGEVVDLKIGDVDFSKGTLHIFDSKFNKSRLVPMGNKVKQYLHKYLILYRGTSENQSYDMDMKKEKFFLEVRTSKPITSEVIRNLFARMKKKTDITRLYPHLLRHTFATSYILGGGNLESLRILLGHSDIMTTQKYIHLAHTYQLNHGDVYKLDKLYFKTYY